MTARDSYRTAMSFEGAIEELRRVAGTQLDPVYVEAFVGIVMGAGVELERDGDAAEELRRAWTAERAWTACRVAAPIPTGGEKIHAAPPRRRPVHRRRLPAGPARAGARSPHSLRAPVTDENFYFVMADRFENGDTANDTGGIPGDRLTHGFDPTAKGFYNGGDLKGLLDRLDYIQDLGTDSIWLTPSFKNKAVQLEDGPSAGYHGYWITDFTQIDPHLGTNADLRALVDAAHARGMKVYFDIITNHTADVIGYEEGARQAYVSKDDEPYRDAAGRVFDDRDFAGTGTFPALDPETSFPYTPVLDAAEEDLKVPGLAQRRPALPQPRRHDLHRRGLALRRLLRPRRPVHGAATRRARDDRHLPDVDRRHGDRRLPDRHHEARRRRVLAALRARRPALRTPPGQARVLHVRRGLRRVEAVHVALHDEPPAGRARLPVPGRRAGFASGSQPTDGLRTFFEDDDWYTDADSNVYSLPTFLGNHDMGRIGTFIAADNPGADDAEKLARDELAHAFMYLSRGNPVIYYGDEQGFTGGNGGDQNARQTMFASRVPDYLDDDLIGTTATHATDNFGRGTRCSARSPASPRSPSVTGRCATAPSSTGCRAPRPGSTRSRGSTGGASASTSSRSTTRRRRRPPRSRRGRRAGCGTGSTARAGDAAQQRAAAPDRHRAAALRGGLRAGRADPALGARAVDRAGGPGAGDGRRTAAWRSPRRSEATRSTRSPSRRAAGAAAGSRSGPTTTRPTASSTTCRGCAAGTTVRVPRDRARQRAPQSPQRAAPRAPSRRPR